MTFLSSQQQQLCSWPKSLEEALAQDSEGLLWGIAAKRRPRDYDAHSGTFPSAQKVLAFLQRYHRLPKKELHLFRRTPEMEEEQEAYIHLLHLKQYPDMYDSVLQRGNAFLEVHTHKNVDQQEEATARAEPTVSDKEATVHEDEAEVQAQACCSPQGQRQCKGYLYILRSLSQHPAIQQQKARGDIVKIGCSTRRVEQRIANAENEATYLYGPVETLLSVACYQCEPHDVEQKLHSFFAQQRLSIEIRDKTTGQLFRPREWFTVSVATVEQALTLLRQGRLGEYSVHPLLGTIQKKTKEQDTQEIAD